MKMLYSMQSSVASVAYQPSSFACAHLQLPSEVNRTQLPADLQLHHHSSNCGQHHNLGINGVWRVGSLHKGQGGLQLYVYSCFHH